MTKKEFRNFLNNKFQDYKDYRIKYNKKNTIKKKYGDYLWFNDRDMFEDLYRRHIEKENL
jgi:hypothetical protein